MRAILVLYMVAPAAQGGLGFDTKKAASIYGTYTMAVYLTAIPGGLVADRLNLPEAGLQSAELVERLASRGVEAGTVAEVRACLEHCDRQRFAPQPTDQHEKSRILERVGTLMTTLDKAVR